MQKTYLPQTILKRRAAMTAVSLSLLLVLQAHTMNATEAALPLLNCDWTSVSARTGFFGQYYNLTSDDPGMNDNRLDSIPDPLSGQNPWYVPEHFSFNRIDAALNFPANFFPINEGKRGDPHNFAVHWRSVLVAPEKRSYEFSLGSDDDSWLTIDGSMVIDLSGARAMSRTSRSTVLMPGEHLLDVYYADRAPYGAGIVLTPDPKPEVYPLPDTCILETLRSTRTAGANGQAAAPSSASGRVLGAESPEAAVSEPLAYTSAVALYRTKNSPDIYAIYANGFRHYISGPTAFRRYGYRSRDVKIVSQETLDRYPDARLLRSLDAPTVYYIYTRPNRRWLKIAIPSPTVFVSYPMNYWGNIVIVDDLDIRAYPDAKLLRTPATTDIYLIEGATRRRLASSDLLSALHLNSSDIVEVSQIHLESYKLGNVVETPS